MPLPRKEEEKKNFEVHWKRELNLITEETYLLKLPVVIAHATKDELFYETLH